MAVVNAISFGSLARWAVGRLNTAVAHQRRGVNVEAAGDVTDAEQLVARLIVAPNTADEKQMILMSFV